MIRIIDMGVLVFLVRSSLSTTLVVPPSPALPPHPRIRHSIPPLLLICLRHGQPTQKQKKNWQMVVADLMHYSVLGRRFTLRSRVSVRPSSWAVVLNNNKKPSLRRRQEKWSKTSLNQNRMLRPPPPTPPQGPCSSHEQGKLGNVSGLGQDFLFPIVVYGTHTLTHTLLTV